MLAVLLLSRMSVMNAKRRASRREKVSKVEKLECEVPDDVFCRTCLGTERLKPLFEGDHKDEKRSHDLKIVTGLEIKKNDGLSQQICSQCIDVMNQALQFRKRSRKTEKVLLNMCSGIKSKKKYSRRLHKSLEKSSKRRKTKIEKLDIDDNFYDTYEYQNCDDYYEVPVVAKKPKVKQKLQSMKKKRMSIPAASSYKCSTCNKEFRMKATYKAHMRFHTSYCVCEERAVTLSLPRRPGLEIVKYVCVEGTVCSLKSHRTLSRNQSVQQKFLGYQLKVIQCKNFNHRKSHIS